MDEPKEEPTTPTKESKAETIAAKAHAHGSAKQNFDVKSTYSPISWLHPTKAVITDPQTGETYEWNSRAHRKRREMAKTDPSKNAHHLPRLWCWEPKIVTWWLNVTNIIANIFWTLSGVYATWPSSNADQSAKIVYAAGIVAGVFMIASCYCSYVEAVNQSSSPVILPGPSPHEKRKKKRREFIHTARVYGKCVSPIHYYEHDRFHSERHKRWLMRMGFPVFEDAETGQLVHPGDLVNVVSSDGTESTADVEVAGNEHNPLEPLVGKDYKIEFDGYTFTTSVIKADLTPGENLSYELWTWHPPLDQLGAILAMIGLVSAIVYLIPMCAGYPLSKNGNASVGVTIFFVDILQVIPYMCFVFTSQCYIAEAAGSWYKPKLDSIGYYACVFNYIGAWGFLLCGALAIPVTLGSDCCPNMATWGSAFACFWGSASYLVGGILQMIEFANPEPIVFGNKHPKQKD